MLDPVTSGAQAPAPAAVSQQPRQPRRRSSSFSSRRPRGERARAASPAPLLTKGGNGRDMGRDNGGSSGDGDGGDGSGVASTPTTASDRATEGGALTVGKVCKFYLRGMCHFGSKCRNLHPDGQEGSAIVCAACGERGHKLKDCMKGGLAAACGPVAADGEGAEATHAEGQNGSTGAGMPSRCSPHRRSSRRSSCNCAKFATAWHRQ